VPGLAVRAPDGGAAGDAAAAQAGVAARAVRVGGVAVAGEPGGPVGDVAGLRGVADGAAQRGVQAAHRFLGQVTGGTGGVQAGPPQGLVDEEVAEAGQDGLVHQRRLQSAAPAGERGGEGAAVDRGRVGPLAAHDVRGCGPVGRAVGQPQAAQFAHVAVAQLPAAVVEGEGDTVVAVRRLVGGAAEQAAGHAEVQEQGRAVVAGAGGGQQPLAVAGGLGEGAAAQPVTEPAGGHAVQHAVVGDVHPRDAPAAGAGGQGPAETLDIGQFRHAAIVRPPRGPRTGARDRAVLDL
jgi:hypothetical protein